MSPSIPRAGIALGSNLGDRLAHLRAARALFPVSPDALVRSAPVFETDPVDCAPGAPSFLNTVVEIAWPTAPADLLARLGSIERQLGRPSAHGTNQSRTVDLDLLYCGETRLETANLQLPHPRMKTRRFVLAPLAVLRPDLKVPGETRSVVELLGLLHDDPNSVRLFASQW